MCLKTIILIKIKTTKLGKNYIPRHCFKFQIAGCHASHNKATKEIY